MVHWSLRFWLLIMSQNTSYMKKKMLRDMSKLVNHQEIIDSKKTNKERQKIQTSKKRHLLIHIYVLLSFKTSSTPGPQTPKPQPSIRFWGNNKNPPAFRAEKLGLGRNPSSNHRAPKPRFFKGQKSAGIIGRSTHGCFFPSPPPWLPRLHAPTPLKKKGRRLKKAAWKNQETNWCFFVKIPPKGHL